MATVVKTALVTRGRARSERLLRRGQVVARRLQYPGREPEPVERGMVIIPRGEPTPPGFRDLRIGGEDDYIIRTQSGTNVMGNLDDEWTIIPSNEWTREERIRHMLLTEVWPGPDPAAAHVSATDTFEWAAIRELLPARMRDDIFPPDGDWPSDFEELFIMIAARLDRLFAR